MAPDRIEKKIINQNSEGKNMAKRIKCKYGKLKSPVRNPKTGVLRRCKLKKKTKKGRSQDRKSKSSEFHEVRYRKEKRKSKR